MTATATTALQTQSIATALLDLALANGGATLLQSGAEADGFVVGGMDRESLVVSADATADQIEVYVDEVLSAGQDIGSWQDPETGLIHLDAVKVFTDRAEAIATAKALGELAIFDTAAMEEIRTN